MDKFNLFVPISKVDKSEEGVRTVTGYASTPALDLDGEIVSINAIKGALPSYMEWRNIRQMHQPIAIGTAKEAHVDDKGLYLTARIIDANAIRLLDEGVLKGFSIGGQKLSKTGNTITRLELIEISIVDRPANPECRIDSIKSATLYGPEEVQETEDERTFLRRMVEKVIGPRDGFQAPAGPIDKREFSDTEREHLANTGDALPDGSYPIKNVKDLHNAVQAFGRAKDKEKTKQHIIARARALGATDALPADWEGSTKEKEKAADSEATKALRALMMKSPELFGDVAEPASLTDDLRDRVCVAVDTYGVGKASEAVGERIGKGCHTVADMAYAFGLIRDTQRRLLIEAAVEKDGDDEKLARQLGELAHELAMIMGQKAEHEGSEALYLTDADDLRFLEYQPNTEIIMLNEKTGDLEKRGKAHAQHLAKAMHHMQKAGKAHAMGMKCLSKCGSLMGKSISAGDVLKSEDIAKHLVQAHEHFTEAADHMEMSHASMAKVSGGSAEAGDHVTDGGEMTGGVKPFISSKTQSEMTEGEVPWYDADKPYPGKAAAAGSYTKEQVEALLKGARAEGENEVLKAELEKTRNLLKTIPAGGARPRIYGGIEKGSIVSGDGDKTKDELLLEGVDLRGIEDDPDAAIKAARRIIGNMVVNKSVFGRSTNDPGFAGGAGLK